MSKSDVTIPNFSHDDLINAYVSGMKKAVDFVQSKIVPVLNGLIELSDRESAILGIFYRVHVLGSSQTRLNNSKDFNAVAINCRTLFELLLDLKLLSAKGSTDTDIKRFHAFPKFDRFKAAKRLSKFQTKNPGVESEVLLDKLRQDFLSNIDEDEIESQVGSLWGVKKNGKSILPIHWSGMNIRERAEHFGAIYIQKYLEIFWWLSSYVHSGSSAYAGLSAKVLEVVYGVSLDISRKIYLESLIICSKTFFLFQAIKDFSQIVEFIRNAPKKILIDYALDTVSKTDVDKQ